jgi:asparagine synthase (glutamine-hydrolysing)
MGGFSDEAVAERVNRAVRLLHRRGPDDCGIASGNGWIFGHSRLAILDPASGRQPWVDSETGIALTYNGELYNFRELRKELEGKGFSFRTRCDTEIIPAAYRAWGAECLNRFNGFFSLVLYDPQEHRIFAARDRIGIKPFYYCEQPEGLCFGSTLPAVLLVAGIPFEPDLETISHYLSTGKLVFGSRTMARNVRKLAPGHTLSYDLSSGHIEIRRYWRRPVLSPAEKEPFPPFRETAERIRELVEDAVRLRLVSDVPVGAFLSGGIDSSVLVSCAFARRGGEPFPLFCAGSDDPKTNEFEYARMMADRLGAPLSETRIDASTFAADWPMLVAEKGEPLSTPNEISIYRLARELRTQCTVTLTGEGADEVFGGYVQPQFAAFDLERCPNRPEDVNPDSSFALAMNLLYGRAFFLNDTDHYLATDCWLTFQEKSDLLLPDRWDELAQDDALFAHYEGFFEPYRTCSAFDRRMHLHAEFNLENLLARVDNSTMSASVEARVPFNDHRLVELLFTLPDSYKISWTDSNAETSGRDLTVAQCDRQHLLESKRLLRSAFSHLLPKEIVERKKMSFPVPFISWLVGDMRKEIRSLCLDSPFARDLFRRDALERMIDGGNRNLWILANLCRWREIMDSKTRS